MIESELFIHFKSRFIMTEINNISSPGNTPVQQTQVVKADAQTAGLAATTQSSTRISSIADLKEKAPEVERAMLMGIAQNMIADMREAEERRKKIAKEHNR